MGLTLMTSNDKVLEQFLHDMNKYEMEKKAAAELWKKAFLSLSRARLQVELGPHQQDPKAKASTTMQSGQILSKENAAPPTFGGLWPPSTVGEARRYVLAALTHELAALSADNSARI